MFTELTHDDPRRSHVHTVWWLSSSNPDPHNLTDPVALPETVVGGKLKSFTDDPEAAIAAFMRINRTNQRPGIVRRAYPGLTGSEKTRLRLIE